MNEINFSRPPASELTPRQQYALCIKNGGARLLAATIAQENGFARDEVMRPAEEVIRDLIAFDQFPLASAVAKKFALVNDDAGDLQQFEHLMNHGRFYLAADFAKCYRIDPLLFGRAAIKACQTLHGMGEAEEAERAAKRFGVTAAFRRLSGDAAHRQLVRFAPAFVPENMA